MKRLTRYFFEGILFLGPIVLTAYIVYVVFVKIDSLFRFDVPGFGFLVTIALITVFGFIASNFLTRKIAALVDRIFARLPVVKMIYNSIKDVISAMFGEKKTFDSPVAVSLVPGSDIWALGFITAESLERFGVEDRVAVYLPQSYNFAGNMILVPKQSIRRLETDGGALMKFIVSGGISS
ncbi:MAG: DUF502 domain-containing protein [Gammaproteobacteria bacterium]|nr:DUF502 domain-containing protein [Gammaproteobacteria bacterium]